MPSVAIETGGEEEKKKGEQGNYSSHLTRAIISVRRMRKFEFPAHEPTVKQFLPLIGPNSVYTYRIKLRSEFFQPPPPPTPIQKLHLR